MTITTIDASQRTAARVVGLSYLLVFPLALFPGVYVSSQLIVPNNAAETARNIMAHETLFRLGIASDLTAFVVDVALIVALYAVLKPISRNLALFAAFVRLIETALFVVVTLNHVDVLRVLSGADYLRAFEVDRLQALAMLSIGAYNAEYSVGLVLAGLGSTVFCYLWFKSGYVPKLLAAWGVFASLVLATCTFVFIIFPDFAKIPSIRYYGGPIFIFELTMGVWLLFKGLRPSGIAEPGRPIDPAR